MKVTPRVSDEVLEAIGGTLAVGDGRFDLRK